MKIKVNGEAKEYEQAVVTVTNLLVLENVASPEMVSVQQNGDFVASSDFDSTQIHDGDEIDFLFFMGGGGVFDLPTFQTF